MIKDINVKTTNFRLFVKHETKTAKDGITLTKVTVLQQEEINTGTGEREWVDVPTVYEKPPIKLDE